MKNEELQAYYESLAKRNEVIPKNKTDNMEMIRWLLIIVAAMVILGVVFGISYVTIKIMHNRTSLRKKSPTDSLYAIMAQIFFLLNAFGLTIADTETLHQFFIRVKEVFHDQGQELEEIEEMYSSVRYSRKEITKEELDRIIAFRHTLLKALREKHGLYVYWVLRLKYSMMTIK